MAKRAKRHEVRIQIQAPLSHQVGPLESEARFKLWRWGRRAGKTRAAFIATAVGHGAKPNGKGFLTGGNILWVARDYTQGETVWYQEYKARFANKPTFDINEQKKRITFEQGGALRVASADNIDSHRGDNWDGVVIDEAAHIDLEYIINDVVRPGLVDTRGWLIVMSTTKFGSYFNRLADEIQQGVWPGWEETHLTAYDNPKMDDEEVDALADGYSDAVAKAQEVFAELTVAGGLAFSEWRPEVHITRMKRTLALGTEAEAVPEHWMAVGVLDWGYVSHGYFGYCRLGEDRQIYVRREYPFRETHPKQVGINIAAKLKGAGEPIPAYIVADAAMWARSESTHTVADKVQEGLREVWGSQAPALIQAPKGPGSRVQGVVAMHEALGYETENEDGLPDDWEAPRLRFHPDCEYAIRTIPRLPRDENNPEDVDTTGEDHAFDALKGLLLMHFPTVEAPGGERGENIHRHPGYDDRGKQKSRKSRIDETLAGEDYLNPGTTYVVAQ